MNDFINYIIESGASLGMFSLVYLTFLRNETFFRSNRLFLLFAVIFSSVIPLLHLNVFQYSNQSFPLAAGTGEPNMLESVTIYGSGLTGSLVGFIIDSRIIVWGYLLIVFICALLLILRIAQIVKVVRTSEVVPKAGIKFVYIDEDSSPYSFLRYLFVSRNLEGKPGWEKMLAHESEHIRQRHTVDILILELISLFQWFNPFFWMMRRVIKENHEYMADRAVLNNGVPVDLYKQILVSQWAGNQFSITNNFNSSLIKLRLKMMTKIKSSKLAGLRYISGGILAIALVLVFACESNVATDPVYNMADEMPVFPDGEPALRKFIVQTIKYPDIAKKNGIKGKVFVSFVVEKDGSVGRAKVVRSVDPSLDNEALRVVNGLPAWKPAMLKGKAVAVQYTVPVNFVLQ
ncbi:MAG: M56 family metallopeptidase [Prolixibacteraceae bacterium]|jgi:TonB family protein|nr:M56 family metallopeptidase [Prolixibacteraceae bacterium]